MRSIPATQKRTSALLRSFVAALLVVAACTGTEADPARIVATSTTSATASTPPPDTATTVTSFDVIRAVDDAAAAMCEDGVVTRDDVARYRRTLRDLGIDPGSALSRTAAIVECGLSNDRVLDLLP